MVSEALKLIGPLIEKQKNFLLSGGAGSGKTFTLLEILNQIFAANSRTNVACITFTKVAAKEIKNRTPYENLWISTIHEFLWSNISLYQDNLKKSLVHLMDAERLEVGSGIKCDEVYELSHFDNLSIQYKDYQKIEFGVISHNSVLKLANHMYKSYPLLCRILKDRYEYILVDEYQDTDELVIEIFLKYINNNSFKKNVIGFFGDSMQSIYSQGIGDINSYIENGAVIEVVKKDNYRCSIAVIELLNKLRPSLIQKPFNTNKSGSITFLYSDTTKKIEDIKKNQIFKDWNFNSTDTKELYLTHRLVAKEKDFAELYQIYSSHNERLLSLDNQDPLIKHLFKIQEVIYLYETKNFNEFIKKTDFKVNRLSDKKKLKENINGLRGATGETVKEIINAAHTLELVKIDDAYKDFVSDPLNSELYNQVIAIKPSQIQNVYSYVKDFTPFSTQHNIKGAEFENVLVVLDTGNWNLYNFEYLFSNSGNANTIFRTKKIFYVCCSRAKNNLVVYFYKPSQASLNKAKEWFGEDQVIKVS